MGFGLFGGVGSVVLFLAVLPVFETVFNCLTAFRVRELTGHDAKLLKKLQQEAPGTFNHSVMVAQLAEACAAALGEDVDYARAAAYYHDVGKLQHPEFFKENQTGANPHDNLDPELSTNIIREHAKCGKSMIAEERLPEILGDVAQQHHGTLPIRFFYGKAAKLTDGHLDIRKFCYYGPVPATKVAAIIMICDAAEAIYRTLADRSREAVDSAVKKVIEERLDFDQFNECPITMAELYVLRKTIVENISMVYHERVAYPKFKISQQMLEEHEQVGGEAQ
ncbi:MAG: HDIG domain-containing protein, partial [Clostridia bacterium]|nr:HDIG domain-containing protein [Clostridia bacterium]